MLLDVNWYIRIRQRVSLQSLSHDFQKTLVQAECVDHVKAGNGTLSDSEVESVLEDSVSEDRDVAP